MRSAAEDDRKKCHPHKNEVTHWKLKNRISLRIEK